jgi:hypothetical protein
MNLMLAQGHNVSVSVVGAVDNVYGQTKSTLCLVVHGNFPRAQRKFKNEFIRQPLHVTNIPHSLKQFKETGSVCKTKSYGRPALI